ncbi:hypothetical protein AEAC466_05455 [Asticcacaulis sp. AC466]|uniref:hypothetical protein n=1 Tax=Asticcacaulis sp. AC466 TaxID=1282362 RepID=UPI0003C3FF61|nr:hypothetical protein [Asticcacaulis sp. AC466]ESQ85158.1 hypothetical protein AEAC466_05455 [Asticcacaulis sp. AC466]
MASNLAGWETSSAINPSICNGPQFEPNSWSIKAPYGNIDSSADTGGLHETNSLGNSFFDGGTDVPATSLNAPCARQRSR